MAIRLLKEYEKAKGEIKEGLDSVAIRKQIRKHIYILRATLEKMNVSRYKWKVSKRKSVTFKQL